MERTNKYEVFTRTYKNPTKLSVVLLLSENKKMTVTQMAKYIKVSRSNLYHFVSQLVDDGLLNEPEIRPTKNYVEKYYSLNEKTFKVLDPKEWEEHLLELDIEEIRSLGSTMLAGQSLVLKLASEQIANASPDEIAKLKKWMAAGMGWVSYSVLSPATSRRVQVHINRIVEELSVSQESDEEEEGELARFLVVFLPLLAGGFS